MYRRYIKKKPLYAIRFTDDFETYKFITKEVKWYTDLAETEEEYHRVKKFGIGVHGTEAHQRLFIGDYLADGGNGDFYVIRKEFMRENYQQLGITDSLEDALDNIKAALYTKDGIEEWDNYRKGKK